VLERRADPAVQPPQLVAIQLGGGTERVESRTPQRLVHVDVPHSREDALVEERRLERCATAREPLSESCRCEERVERLVADAGGEVRLCLAGLEQQPRAEAPDVAVRNVRSVF